MPPEQSSTHVWPRKLDGLVGKSAVEFAQQAEKLSHHHTQDGTTDPIAVEAHFVTPHDPVVITSDGNRLPAVPLDEAHKLNALKEELEYNESITIRIKKSCGAQDALETATEPGHEKVINIPANQAGKGLQKSAGGNLRNSMPPSHTNPLFPPLPLYGPTSVLRSVQCLAFRFSSFFLGLAFLAVIVLGSLFTSLPPFLQHLWHRMTFRNPNAKRPFFQEEVRRARLRKGNERKWDSRRPTVCNPQEEEGSEADSDGFTPTEGGRDPIVCNVGYYARRVGLDVEEHQVQTEDGFILDLWHVFDPKEYTPLPEKERAHRGPEVFTNSSRRTINQNHQAKFPVLLVHGLLQSSGAYCVNDDDSLAFFLCKSGFDVWLGNNRCGFEPKHVLLEYSDPRMWCWNIRQMGVFDLPALTSRVVYETGFGKVGLICHSQGTTQALVALAKEQRPDLGERLTVFCALAPAAYAGPLIGKMYFKFMRVISPAMFRLMFGIHAFIPFMMTMHATLNPRIYGWMGYKVFSFLFNWTDERWDRGLKDRMFQFAPVYVSAESMRWWLGRECFAKHKCILATKEEWRAEEREDHEQEEKHSILATADQDMIGQAGVEKSEREAEAHRRKTKGSTAWYNHQAPPFALWVCGNDRLVDGDKLLRRFERGREPHVRVVHTKVIKEYEHLDVIWAIDAVDRVFKEIREVLWKTCNARDTCRVPRGCEDVREWLPKREPDEVDDGPQSSSSEWLSW
ncbi:Alpha/Beta hydrolase protein [Lasiosphaeris hirsuta]|uniref:Alpha/Beta hydrolase protein n=1 Tax=Lasiosphaeris hirsuta TaxID=260670 RepID=A0AA40BCL3_9PEZI|nr:Alpha/Beta hydrolase protein [Lasiosphaeris hirsuta]